MMLYYNKIRNFTTEKNFERSLAFLCT